MSVKCVFDCIVNLLSLVECLALGRQTICHTRDDKRDGSESRLLIDFRKTRWVHTHTHTHVTHPFFRLYSHTRFPKGKVSLSSSLGQTRIGYMRNSLLTPEVTAGLTRRSARRNKTRIINA
ncbi:hypothetical protein XENORESO_004160 [Xenotaenia resolanae]|uniref:Secreted protein n=1 Tax=Xenotaenia resolanae TaxID=208358 RepID=A0ABV0W7Z2_9TELE